MQLMQSRHGVKGEHVRGFAAAPVRYVPVTRPQIRAC